jgi:sarcosine oxidase subunit alpha
LDRRLTRLDPAARVTIRYEGEEIDAQRGETVAVALFASGENVLSRSVKYHRPRGFFCLDGHCGACLMRIGGRPNMKACRAVVSDGLECERQNAFPTGGFDVLGAADFLFAKGMDHHTMMTSPRALNAVMQKLVRQLGGLGRLPDEAPGELPRAESRHVDALVIGAGPAGLAAATAIARAGKKTLLVDEQERTGGSYLAHPDNGPAAADRAEAQARAAGVEIATSSAVLAFYPEDVARKGAKPGLVAAYTPRGLWKLTAERTLYATGAYDQNALFRDNDRPGVLSARAVGRLLVRFGIRAGERPVVLGAGPYAQSLAVALERAGAKVTRVDGVDSKLTAAHGHSWIKSVEVIAAGEKRARKIACDLLAVAALPAPASELPRQHGVEVAFDAHKGGFACTVDERGVTSVPSVFACGDVTGFVGCEGAAAHGARVGAAVAESFA